MMRRRLVIIGLAALAAACAPIGPLGPPTTSSDLAVNTVTDACVPLRAEFTVQGQVYVRGLFLEPNCPGRDHLTTDCYVPAADHPACSFSCPELTYWKHVNGTTYMHRFHFSIEDDGTNPESLSVTVHLKLSTLDDTLVWEGDQTEDLPPLADQRAGYFHSGLMEMQLGLIVWQALGKSC